MCAEVGDVRRSGDTSPGCPARATRPRYREVGRPARPTGLPTTPSARVRAEGHRTPPCSWIERPRSIQEQGGFFQHARDVSEEAAGDVAVDDPVIEARAH